MEFKCLIFNDDSVACIDSTLVAYDHICRLTEQVSDFTLSFIAPLGTYDNYVSQDSL